MKKFSIVAKKDDESIEIAHKIKEGLIEEMEYDEFSPELVISVGGDGTMLYSVHKYIHKLDDVKFVGIHTGTLGFYTDYAKEDYKELIKDILKDEYTVLNRSMLEVCIDNVCYKALNEVRIENNRRAQVLTVCINDEELEVFRGNGLCISTSSGSTAYNKSIGGAVISSSNDLMQLSEIAGIHHNAYRSLGSPLILDRTHTITIHSSNLNNSILGVDQDVYELKDSSVIQIRLSDKKVQCVQYKEVSLISRLKRSFF